MLNAEAVQEIASMTISEVKEIDGHKFHITNKAIGRIPYPTIKEMGVFSLTEFVNFIKDEKGLFVNIEGYSRVAAYKEERNKNLHHDCVAFADFSKIFEPFPLAIQMPQQDFILNLLTKFKDSEDRTELSKLVSSVKAERVKTSEDDGVSQVVSTKGGIHLSESTRVNNLWLLQTYKTFPEVSQPIINYILRLHQRDEEIPKFALYECDGGAWKIGTIKSIREFLEIELSGVNTVRIL